MEGGELIPSDVSEKDVREEACRRGAKLGHCTKYGEPPFRTKIMAAPPTRKYEENYIKIFGHD